MLRRGMKDSRGLTIQASAVMFGDLAIMEILQLQLGLVTLYLAQILVT